MAEVVRRGCRSCYGFVGEDGNVVHSWYCPHGDGLFDAQPKESRRRDDAGGSGGSDPGERNIPPLPDAPGGGGITIELSPSDGKPDMIDYRPALALPMPDAEVRDEQGIRDNRVGKS